MDNMKLILAVCFTVISLPDLTLTASPGVRSVVFPEETSTSYVEMIPQKPLSLKAFTLCMRLATELKGEREIILFAYRTEYYDELNVWRELDGRLGVYLSGVTGKGVFFDVPAFGALETHLCVVWDSGTGQAVVYLNGKKSSSKIYKKGHTVQTGGRIVLGQDPDKLLGGFCWKQSFVGEIRDVNMWDYVLSPGLIQDLDKKIRVPPANVLDWDTVELKQNGDVHIIKYML